MSSATACLYVPQQLIPRKGVNSSNFPSKVKKKERKKGRWTYTRMNHVHVGGGIRGDLSRDQVELIVIHCPPVGLCWSLADPIRLRCLSYLLLVKIGRHLYKECESTNLLGRFRFVNPYEVSHNPKIKLAKKAEILANGLIGVLTNQFVLIPCNVGFHWVEIVYFLDPLSNEMHHQLWKDVVDMAIKLFNASIGKRGRKNAIWEVIKCPQQPDSKQCGFYVMRYMRDIIENCGYPVTISLPLV
ncbi:hypothetical protein C2S51_017082, partial [Perilla frutescens var. frutescens]